MQDYIHDNCAFIGNLALHLNFENNDMVNDNDTDLSGMTFVVTGKLNIFKNRNELIERVESVGGKVSGSVSKNTTYLVNNDVDSSSSKNKKAKELNIPIITEQELYDMV